MSPGKGSEGPVGRDSADPHDDDLTALYRQAAQDEPPVRQDAAVLAAAARELASDATARAPHIPLWKRLRVPLAFAATALFATTLSVLVEREQSRSVERPASAPAPKPDAALEQKAETAPKAATSAAPPADSSKMTAKPRQPSAFAPPSAPAPAPATAPAVPPGATMSEAPPAQSELRRERPIAEGVSRPEAADSATAEAPASSPARSDQNSAGALGRMRSAKQAAPATAAPEPPLSPQPPQAWLDEIARLADAGKMDEARAALRDFRRAYPEYPLPERLAPLAPAP